VGPLVEELVSHQPTLVPRRVKNPRQVIQDCRLEAKEAWRGRSKDEKQIFINFLFYFFIFYI
jgi:hypothetical protein